MVNWLCRIEYRECISPGRSVQAAKIIALVKYGRIRPKLVREYEIKITRNK